MTKKICRLYENRFIKLADDLYLMRLLRASAMTELVFALEGNL